MAIELISILARIIDKRFSNPALAIASSEPGGAMPIGGTIFQAMTDAGKAVNFDEAVQLVAAHLDNEDSVE